MYYEKLVEMIQQLGVQQVSALLHISQRTVYRWKNKKTQPNILEQQTIERVYNDIFSVAKNI
jgi:DNA invertase Pin-like site-specific DNA recombinase